MIQNRTPVLSLPMFILFNVNKSGVVRFWKQGIHRRNENSGLGVVESVHDH